MRWDRTKGRPEPIRALNLIPERDNGDPLVPLSEVCPSVRVLRSQVIPYLRKEVAEMLERASQTLPEGVHFSVWDAWRPLARQRRIYEFMTQCALEAFPDLTYSALKRKVNRWVAPWDQPAPPGHCTGAAVDVALVDSDGNELDVTSPFARFVASPTYTLGLSPEAKKNRDILVESMLSVGFSNCRDEYWHYSYGDAGWAVRTGAKECFYGTATLSQQVYEEAEQVWLEKLLTRPNPFLEGKDTAP